MSRPISEPSRPVGTGIARSTSAEPPNRDRSRSTISVDAAPSAAARLRSRPRARDAGRSGRSARGPRTRPGPRAPASWPSPVPRRAGPRPAPSNSPEGFRPQNLVELDLHAHGQTVLEDPFRQAAGVEVRPPPGRTGSGSGRWRPRSRIRSTAQS